jgi:hypothetical protein
MKKQKISVNDLKKDIKNAEKYFERSGNSAKEAYKLLEEEITENDSVTQTVYLYIPGTVRDIYEVFLN